ncbi:hypothetical protein K6L05_15000, partial [Salinicoccus roseus]|uniref:hypothetical protein n=1 Tax=Salinicoccus roseus TaxID=45670 RepID=UPI001CA792BB
VTFFSQKPEWIPAPRNAGPKGWSPPPSLTFMAGIANCSGNLKLYALFSDVLFIIQIFNHPLLKNLHWLRMERAQKKGAEE